jgi:guanosine-3',5'-bis(diphosphate) 3'-pyrophosphohydrolase
MHELHILVKAIDFAATRHRDQRRKDAEGTPYINHPIALAALLIEHVGTDDLPVIISAILHDTVEDTETTPDELEEHFGRQVRDIVMEVTDDTSLPKEIRRRLQIEHAGHSSYQARLVKLADKICNLRDMHDHPPAKWSLDRKRAYYDWAKDVIDQLRGTHTELEAIFDAVYNRRP